MQFTRAGGGQEVEESNEGQRTDEQQEGLDNLSIAPRDARTRRARGAPCSASLMRVASGGPVDGTAGVVG